MRWGRGYSITKDCQSLASRIRGKVLVSEQLLEAQKRKEAAECVPTSLL